MSLSGFYRKWRKLGIIGVKFDRCFMFDPASLPVRKLQLHFLSAGASRAPMRNSTFFPFGAPPIANLEKRVRMQRAALVQAEADLAEARGERAIAEIEELAEEPTPFISNEHRRVRAADERRRRGLGDEQGPAFKPVVRTTAQQIIDADRKARGEK